VAAGGSHRFNTVLFLFWKKAVKHLKQQETTILLKITAALRIFLSPVIRTSNCRRDGGVVLLIIVVSSSIFTTFLLGILLEKIVFLHFLCQHWISQ
jgi:hypothetical protein